jgi:hypothetical protein
LHVSRTFYRKDLGSSCWTWHCWQESGLILIQQTRSESTSEVKFNQIQPKDNLVSQDVNTGPQTTPCPATSQPSIWSTHTPFPQHCHTPGFYKKKTLCSHCTSQPPTANPPTLPGVSSIHCSCHITPNPQGLPSTCLSQSSSPSSSRSTLQPPDSPSEPQEGVLSKAIFSEEDLGSMTTWCQSFLAKPDSVPVYQCTPLPQHEWVSSLLLSLYIDHCHINISASRLSVLETSGALPDWDVTVHPSVCLFFLFADTQEQCTL